MTNTGRAETVLNFRPEIELLLCCARTQMEAETATRMKALFQQTLDWEYLLRMAIRHGVMPLLFWQINANLPEIAPAEFMTRLREHFYLNAARNHFLTEELVRVLRLFEEQNIPAIPYKGPALALSIYGDTALRQFSDLDLLIQRKDVVRASDVLRTHGYTSQHQLTPAQEAAFLNSTLR